MKRRRRVEIRVERHELSIFAGTAPAQPANPTGAPMPDTPASPNRASTLDPQLTPGASPRSTPESCPICGSQEMLPLAEAIARATPTNLKDGLESGRYHLHCSRSGDWWVCGQSLRPG